MKSEEDSNGIGMINALFYLEINENYELFIFL